MRSIALIGCGKEKLPRRAKARDLYTGALFAKALAHVSAGNFDAAFVLSAKHGLVELDEEIEPYDLRISDFDGWERADWGHAVFLSLELKYDTRRPLDLVVFAGADYAEPLRWQLADVSLWGIVEPLKGLGIGERLRWLNQHASGEVHP